MSMATIINLNHGHQLQKYEWKLPAGFACPCQRIK